MNKTELIHNFIRYALYNNVVGKSTDLVYQLYKVYKILFDTEELERNELQTLICQEYDCMIQNGVYNGIKEVN